MRSVDLGDVLKAPEGRKAGRLHRCCVWDMGNGSHIMDPKYLGHCLQSYVSGTFTAVTKTLVLPVMGLIHRVLEVIVSR